ncbi:TniQ family protein [Rhodanobacter soli]|uniref:TniQ domain-containing protein n=1 Tax=Rhodanobacter soli TaxID=590609 RepID=A0ABV2PW89_9GAMM
MRTILAPLRLHGLGTPLVESLMSYFCRLADVHQVTPKQLAKVLCNDSVYLRTDDTPQLKSIDLYPRIFCAHSGRTAVVVQRLERLTGAGHLTCGTLLRLRDVLSRNQTGSCVQRRRWCPICYAQQDDVIIEPLAWWIPQITHCPLHEARLIDRCARCGCYQIDWRIGPTRKLCIKCGFALKMCAAVQDDRTHWEAWCQAQMLKVLEHIAAPTSADVSPDVITTFITKVVSHAPTEGYRRPVSKEALKLRVQGHRLVTIFDMAARWGTTPMDILLRPGEAVSPSLFESDIDTPRPPRRRAFNKRGYRLCIRTLHKLLTLPRTTTLPPLADICLENRVSVSSFHRNYSKLCKTYGDERRLRIDTAKNTRFSVACSYVARLLEELQRSGKRLHRMNAVAQMMREIHVPKAVARSALRVALAKMTVCREPH